MPREILWGHRFENMVYYNKKDDEYVADFDKFDATTTVDTPLCSAKRLDEVITEVNSFLKNQQSNEPTPMLRHKV